jgi:ubiquinone/menaquinone biosynthesis C-methylase UbiE
MNMNSTDNHWLQPKTAKAFKDQHKAIPYQELLEDTIGWCNPRAGERWLDLGCGAGQLTKGLWAAADGKLAEIVGSDCNPANEELYLKQALSPSCPEGARKFVLCNFSAGLAHFPDNHFDGLVSGLAITYAEHKDPKTGKYTDQAYTHLLSELRRVLKPGGRAVVSVNVPEPNFVSIMTKSFGSAFRIRSAGKAFVNGLRMLWTGRWLRQQARIGRFHYYPAEEVARRLEAAGFPAVRHRISYADQAIILRADRDPANSMAPQAA